MASDTPDATDSPSVSDKKRRLERAQLKRRIVGSVGLVAILYLTYRSMRLLEFELADFVRRLPNWIDFVSAFLSPDFVDFTLYTKNNGIEGFRGLWVSLTNPQYLLDSTAAIGYGNVLVAAAVTTVVVGFLGTVLGFPLALLFGILGSERVTPFPFNFVFRGTMSTIRAVPALIWVLIYIPLFSLSPKTAVLAIATDTVGNMGRLFTDELEEIDDGPIDAIRSTGASQPQVVIFGMLSQVSNAFIAWTLYVLEINTRIAISLGVVGAGGLGQYIQNKIGFTTPDAYAQAAAGLVVVVLIVLTVEITSSRIRARLRPGENGTQKSMLERLRGLFDVDRWLGTSR